MEQIFAISIAISSILLEKYKIQPARIRGKNLRIYLINDLYNVCIILNCAHTVDMLQLLVY